MDKIYVLCIILLFNLISCNTLHHITNEDELGKIEVQETISPIIVGSWKLEKIKGHPNDAFVNVPLNKTITLTIAKEGKISGNNGCNQYFGKIKVENSVIAFFDITSTQRGCNNQTMIEKTVYNAFTFRNINNYTIENDKLLLKADAYPLMIFSKM